MADHSGRTDLAVGDIAEAGAKVVDYIAGTGGVTKGQALEFSADLTVITCSGVAKNFAGVALKTVAVGGIVPVLINGVVKVTVGAAVAIGAPLEGIAAGQFDTLALVGAVVTIAVISAYAGHVLTAATTGAGDLILMRVTKG